MLEKVTMGERLAPGSYATAESPAATGQRERDLPLLFLHIPKTAGTSLLTSLGNALGDVALLRLVGAALEPAGIEALVNSPRMQSVRCVTGHFPINAFARYLVQFRPFTVLRDPLSRVISLYRFMRRRDPEELRRLHLPERFSMDEMLASRHPEIFGQVRNAMCRMLSGRPELNDGVSSAFWSDSPDPGAIDAALGCLERIEFGLTERMPETLDILTSMLRPPVALTATFENMSEQRAPDLSASMLQRIVALNAADIVLYREASAAFAGRVAAYGAAGGSAAADHPLIQPETGRETQISAFLGRQGFYAFEEKVAFAWLTGTTSARLVFATDANPAVMRLKVYRIIDRYPIDEIDLRVNQNRVPFRWSATDSQWGVIETGAFRTATTNLVEIDVPFSVPARSLNPDSRDRRSLSLAISTVTLSEAR